MSGKTLIVVDGPSGAGKSDMLRWASDRYDGVVAIKKWTTRQVRDAEAAADWSDLIHVPAVEFERHLPDYAYSWNGHRYGFSRAHLRSMLRNARIGLVVVRHADTIRRLVSDLPDLQVTPVLVDAAAAVRRQRLLADGLRPEEVDPLIGEKSDARARDLYRRRIVNDGSREDFRQEVAALLAEVSRG